MKKVTLALVLVLFSSTVFSQNYDIISLGIFDGIESCAYSINDSGYVVGKVKYEGSSNAPFPENTFLWNPTQIIMLGQADTYQVSAYSINNSCQVVGYTKSTVESLTGAFYWDNQNGMQYFNSLENNTFSASFGINNSGQMAVWTHQSDEHYSIMHSSYFGNIATGFTVIDFPTPLGGVARDISDAGQIVGMCCSSLDEPAITRAYIWQNGQISFLDSLGGYSDKAVAINSSGTVVGSSFVSFITPEISLIHATLWSDDTVYDLGTLGGYYSQALNINEGGVVVGYSEISDGTQHACLWQEMQITDLNELLPVNSEWDYLKSAYDINIHGQIVGVGIIDGVQHAFLMTPTPEPSTLLLFSLGFIIVRKKKNLSISE